MIRLLSEDQGDKIVYQYYVLEYESGNLVPFISYNEPTEIDGTIYQPTNGRFEIIKPPDFQIKPRIRDMNKQLNNSLNDERWLFGLLMRIMGWWG